MKRLCVRCLIGVLFVLGIWIHPLPAGAIGGQFGLEFAIDAPWRLEPVPVPGGGYTYGPIPIVVAFHDAVYELDRGTVGKQVVFPQITVGRLLYVEVVEWAQDQPTPTKPVTRIRPSALREIERKRPVSTKQGEPAHEVCRPFLGQDCSPLLDISDSHEWHAMFWYTSRAPVTPGRNIHLEVTVVTRLTGVTEGFRLNHEWKNYLVVHAGEEPIPRFSDKWLYGDLHYHSQMTDNEGESAYSYRNVARALGALGMDFVFTTDHASNGEQVDGKTSAKYCGRAGDGYCFEARDLNERRFAAAKSILYGPDGANESVARDAAVNGLARVRSANILPQLYMGEEVDAWPEISSKEQQDGVVYYGDGLKYLWPNPNNCIQKEGLEKCRAKYSRPYTRRDHRTYLLGDEQGIPIEETIDDKFSGHTTLAGIVKFFTPDLTLVLPSRQHLVYLPNSASLSAEGWIASDTGQFGGAGKRLQDVIQEVQAGGVAFLAHPLTNDSPGGPGPDIIPYSDTELNRAWSSPAFLGLQMWNENDRFFSAPNILHPQVMRTGASPSTARVTEFFFEWPFQEATTSSFPWFWQQRAGLQLATELYHDAFTWDRYLRKGLNPVETAGLTWLFKGDPRKWFMAGGSDSHGDFNYRRHGRPCLDRWCDVPVGDTAIGKPRNLVLVSQAPAGQPTPALPGAKRYTNSQVIDALRAGQFSVTDGPAVRIAIDKNRNGKIDDDDHQMGSTFNFYPGEHIPLLVEWKSSPEFGPVAQVHIYVGNLSNTFAPKQHGPTLPRGADRNAEYGSYQPDPSGALQVKLVDDSVTTSDGSRGGRILLGVSPATPFHGLAKLFLGPNQFGLAKSDQALFYVRAFARTTSVILGTDKFLFQCAKPRSAGNSCGDPRWAYSNPIWGRYRVSCPPKQQSQQNPQSGVLQFFPLTASLDGDNNNVPDTCEREIPDPCPPAPTIGSHLGQVTPFGQGGASPVVVDPSRPIGPQPAKPIPRTSCQMVTAVVRPILQDVIGPSGTVISPPNASPAP